MNVWGLNPEVVITLAESLRNCGKGRGEESFQLKTSVMGKSRLSPFLAIRWRLSHHCVKSRTNNTATHLPNVFILLLHWSHLGVTLKDEDSLITLVVDDLSKTS